jgi:hypothetical protein
MTRNRRDNNHKDILKCADKFGYRYWVTADLKHGFTDTLIQSKSGVLVLVEIKGKDEDLTPDEKIFFQEWHESPVEIARTCEEFLEIMSWYDSEVVVTRDTYHE